LNFYVHGKQVSQSSTVGAERSEKVKKRVYPLYHRYPKNEIRDGGRYGVKYDGIQSS